MEKVVPPTRADLTEALLCMVDLGQENMYLNEILGRVADYIGSLPADDFLHELLGETMNNPDNFRGTLEDVGDLNMLKGLPAVWLNTGKLLFACLGFTPMKLAEGENWRHGDVLVRHAFDLLFSLTPQEAEKGIEEKRAEELHLFLDVARAQASYALEDVPPYLQGWLQLEPTNPKGLAEWVATHRTKAPQSGSLSGVLKTSLEELRGIAMKEAKGIK